MTKALSVFVIAVGLAMLLMPLWADDTPPYPPIIGTLVIGPVFVVAGIWSWRAS